MDPYPIVSTHFVGDPPLTGIIPVIGRRRALVGWNHQDDTEDGRELGQIFGWTSVAKIKDRAQPKFQVYDTGGNRSLTAGVHVRCGPANFTMVRMFAPYWVLPNGRVPKDMNGPDKKYCRKKYWELLRKKGFADECDDREGDGDDDLDGGRNKDDSEEDGEADQDCAMFLGRTPTPDGIEKHDRRSLDPDAHADSESDDSSSDGDSDHGHGRPRRVAIHNAASRVAGRINSSIKISTSPEPEVPSTDATPASSNASASTQNLGDTNTNQVEEDTDPDIKMEEDSEAPPLSSEGDDPSTQRAFTSPTHSENQSPQSAEAQPTSGASHEPSPSQSHDSVTRSEEDDSAINVDSTSDKDVEPEIKKKEELDDQCSWRRSMSYGWTVEGPIKLD